MIEPIPSQQAASAAATPKTTTLERVARAIADANDEDFDALPDLHLALAQAALQALLQVDDELGHAILRRTRGHDSRIQSSEDYAEECFTAAIDHILEQKA